jgi:hypothetical protein
MHANGRSRTYLRCSLATIFLKEADSVAWTEIDERRFGHVNYPSYWIRRPGRPSSAARTSLISSSSAVVARPTWVPLARLS